MSSCNEKRFQSMLHHYELGLLGDEDRLQFEAHLLECDYCFEEVKRFQRVARLMAHDPEIRDTVRQLDDRVPAEHEVSSRRKWFAWSRLVPTSAVAVLVLVFLVLKDWQVDIRPSEEAFAHENRLAVMPFENLGDPEDSTGMGAIAANLLITDLSQSQYVQVLSSQRLQDILKKAGPSDEEPIAETAALETARTARAKWVLQGSIVQVEPSLVVTIQLIEVAEGTVIASHRVSSKPGEDIFAVVDRLTVAVKSDLTLPAKAQQEEDRSIADVTTNSVDAFRYYLEGIRFQTSFYFQEAIAAYHQALEYDSTFAMVYYYLAELEDRNLIEQAVTYSVGASWKEQRYIRAKQASLAYDNKGAIVYLREIIERYPDEKNALMRLAMNEYALTDFQSAAEHYLAVIKIDPGDKGAFNQLAYTYSALGNLDSAIWAANKYIELAPDEANPYDSRGDLYAVRGKLDEAIESFRAALEIKSDYFVSLEKLGHMYVFKGEFERADSVYRVLGRYDDANQRSLSRLFLTYGTLRQGRRRDALRLLDDGIARNRTDQIIEETYQMHRMKALIYEDMGQFEKAMTELDTSSATCNEPTPITLLAMDAQRARVLAKMGNHDLAEQTVEKLRTDLQESGYSGAKYYCAAAIAAWYRGDAEAALTFAGQYEHIDDKGFDYPQRFTLARLYLETDRLETAVTEFEDLLQGLSCAPFYWGTFGAKSHYYLGRAYEESRWYDKAIVQYETFLELWGDGDTDIEEITDTRERLARLESKP